MAKNLVVLGFWLCPCCARILYHLEGTPVTPDNTIYECGFCDRVMEYQTNFPMKEVVNRG